MKRPWREVLEYGNSPAQREAIQRHYRILASSAHPDKGGTAERMAELNAARDEALQEAGHA
jgi:DnaJ-class molecular chaperone